MKVLNEYLTLINEAVGMTPAELGKQVGGVGEFRDSVLLKRIQSGQPIEMKVGPPITVDTQRSQRLIQLLNQSVTQLDDMVDKQDFFAKNSKQLLFFPKLSPEEVQKLPPAEMKKYKNGLPLSQLKKAGYFGGGGGGKRGGAPSTQLFEPGTAMTMAVASHLNRPMTPEDITVESLAEASAKYEVSTNPKAVMDFVAANPQWMDTFVNSANALFKSFPEARKMIFHHQSSWVKRLYGNYSAANKKIGGFFTGPDKWNPSDIWGVTSDAPLPPKGAKSFDELNKWTHEMFDAQKVYGMSLKASPKGATAKRVNYAGAPSAILSKSVKDILTGKTNSLFNSAKSHITFESKVSFLGDYDNILEFIAEADSGEVEFRAFQASPVDMQGELQGDNAAHGKVGLPVINKYLRDSGLEEVTGKEELISQWREDKPEFIDKIVELAAAVNPSIKATAKESLEKKVKKSKNSYPAGFFISKRQAIELAYNVSRGTQKQQNNFLMGILKYAGSESEFSSVYIKIS